MKLTGLQGCTRSEFTWYIFSLSVPFLYVLRSYSSWHYPNSPKNRKTRLSPRRDWLQRGSTLK
ncbi:hypothetical protein BK244_25770 [Escherichia coli]|nr:hypothetical protein BK244_25770 [Escherichia coli]